MSKDLGFSRCGATLKQLLDLIRRSEPNDTSGAGLRVGARNMGKRLQWTFKKEEVRELLVRLGRHKAMFQLALGADTLYVRAPIDDVF